MKAVIAPHAGLRYAHVTPPPPPHASPRSYSGKTAAYAYRELAESLEGAKRVFVLGPCHCQYFDDIKLTNFDVYEGPIMDLAVDKEANARLVSEARKSGVRVSYLSGDTDIDEHSIELQMPFLSYILKQAGSAAKIVPVVVGHLDDRAASRYGELLAPYFQDPDTRFVVSSDFCHWGSRFRYTHHYQPDKYPNVGDAVIAMDHEGMKHIEERNIGAFNSYLTKTGNTICGRVPISIVLESMAGCNSHGQVQFVHYSQSSKCQTKADSSVSYASAVITI